VKVLPSAAIDEVKVGTLAGAFITQWVLVYREQSKKSYEYHILRLEAASASGQTAVSWR
jgi:hypothetical protein